MYAARVVLCEDDTTWDRNGKLLNVVSGTYINIHSKLNKLPYLALILIKLEVQTRTVGGHNYFTKMAAIKNQLLKIQFLFHI
jgi:hypothetical protein